MQWNSRAVTALATEEKQHWQWQRWYDAN